MLRKDKLKDADSSLTKSASEESDKEICTVRDLEERALGAFSDKGNTEEVNG
jgi:hypothetical protein